MNQGHSTSSLLFLNKVAKWMIFILNRQVLGLNASAAYLWSNFPGVPPTQAIFLEIKINVMCSLLGGDWVEGGRVGPGRSRIVCSNGM